MTVSNPLELQPLSVVTRLTDSRMDMTCLIEYGEVLPILFSTRDQLVRWTKSKNLSVKTLRCVKPSDGVRTSGMFPLAKLGARMWVDFVWVRSGWGGYRSALQARSRDAGEESCNLSPYLHADHLMARKRTELLDDPWVLLIEVPKYANSAFGSRIERAISPLPSTTQRYNLSGLEVFKIYCEALPGPMSGTLRDAFDRVRNQFLTENEHARVLLNDMEHAVAPFFS